MLLKYNQLVAIILILVSGNSYGGSFIFDSKSSAIQLSKGAVLYNAPQAMLNKEASITKSGINKSKIFDLLDEESSVYRACGSNGCQCVTITSDTCFDLNMLPLSGGATIFCFDACQDRCANKPRLIFDPSSYGNGGKIVVPANSSLIFIGDGIVELLDGVEFDLQGTSYCLDPNPPANPQLDWPSIVIEEGAILHVEDGATAAIGGGDSSDVHNNSGAGCIVIRRGGSIQLDGPSQLIFGNTYNDQLEVVCEYTGAIVVNNSCAYLTFQKGCVNLFLDHLSVLNVAKGFVEFNMYRGSLIDLQGNVATGILNKFCIDEGSVLEVLRRGVSSGLLRFAPNFNPDTNFSLGLDIPVDFNNRCSQVAGGGQIQFKEFINAEITLAIDLPVNQGIMIAAASTLSQTIDFDEQTFYSDVELTADTLIPAQSILKAGTFIKAGSTLNGVAIVTDTTLVVDTTVTINSNFVRLSQINVNSIFAAFTIQANTPLTFAILVPPLSKIPAGSTLAVQSERVNTTLNLQTNLFETIAPIVNVFMELGYIPLNSPTQDKTILVDEGSFNPLFDGALAALCPPIRNGSQRDGSIVLLQSGDYDVQYNKSLDSAVLNQVFGYTFDGKQFVISNCDQSTRSET